MQLPIRAGRGAEQFVQNYPSALDIRSEQSSTGIPSLWGTLDVPAAQPVVVTLKIHNQAGIPIIEGRTQIERGERQFSFHNLQPLGIEAYAHKSDVERVQIGQRIWSRGVYGTLTFQPTC